MIKIAEKKAKEVFKVKGTCPHCGKKMIVKKTKKTIAAAVPAEVEEKVIIEKDSQTTLPKIGDSKMKK